MKEKVVGVLKNKIVLIVVAVVVALYIVAFPHTKTTTVEGQLAGIYVTTKEHYLFHSLTSIETTNVCNGTVTVRTNTVKYFMNGDVKAVITENCNTSGSELYYNKNGTIKESLVTTLVGNNYQTVETSYTEYGQVIERVTTLSTGVVTTVNSYDENNVLSKEVVTTYNLGQKIEEEITNYDNGDVVSGTYTEYENGDVTNHYTMTMDGTDSVFVIEYTELNEEINITCDDSNVCHLDEYDAPTFNIAFDDTTSTYILTKKADDTTQTIVLPVINTWSLDSDLEDVKDDALSKIE